MTAGIFAMHGVWTGEYRGGDDINRKGHFENLHFKKIIKKYNKTRIHHKKDRPFPEDAQFLKEFLEVGPEEPWLIKGSAMYWKLFLPLSPKYICVRRNKSSAMQSCKRVGLYFDGMKESFDRHAAEMDYLVKERGGVNVYTDEVIAGDYYSLNKAFEYTGLTLDSNIVDEFVDKKLWHYKS